MSSVDALILLVLTFPLVIWAAWSDLKFMIIPNKLCLALLAVFVLVAPFLLPLPEFGIRLLQGAIVLAITFTLNALGLMGGGDAKLFAVIAPFINRADVAPYFFILALLALAAVALHRLAFRIGRFATLVEGWKSFGEKRNFPFGLPLAASLTGYLLWVALQ